MTGKSTCVSKDGLVTSRVKKVVYLHDSSLYFANHHTCVHGIIHAEHHGSALIYTIVPKLKCQLYNTAPNSNCIPFKP